VQVAQIESEAQQLREAVISKQGTIKSLERRVNHLEVEVQELAAKVRFVLVLPPVLTSTPNIRTLPPHGPAEQGGCGGRAPIGG
jgi:hypothetical protein